MATEPRRPSPHYVKYTHLLRELHSLVATGEGDSQRADELRDAMDEPWKSLTSEEAERARLLADQLNAGPPADRATVPVARADNLKPFTPAGG